MPIALLLLLVGCAPYRQWRYAAGFNGMQETLDEIEKAKKRGRPLEVKQKPFWTGALTALNIKISQIEFEKKAEEFKRALDRWGKGLEKSAADQDKEFKDTLDRAVKETDEKFRLECEATPGRKWTGSFCEDAR